MPYKTAGTPGEPGADGHSPTVNFGSGADADRLTIDGTATGPHLTGPAGADGATGAAGTDGTDGATGAPGADGATWTNTAGTPDNANGANGDYNLDTTTGNVHKKIAGAWTLQGNIKGATGATGAAGSNGTNGTNGTNGQGVPTGGTDGQVLTKTSGTDYDTAWETPTGGGSEPDGGTRRLTASAIPASNSAWLYEGENAYLSGTDGYGFYLVRCRLIGGNANGEWLNAAGFFGGKRTSAGLVFVNGRDASGAALTDQKLAVDSTLAMGSTSSYLQMGSQSGCLAFLYYNNDAAAQDVILDVEVTFLPETFIGT